MLLDFAIQAWGMAAGSMGAGLPVANALTRLMSGPQHSPPLDTNAFHLPVKAAA